MLQFITHCLIDEKLDFLLFCFPLISQFLGTIFVYVSFQCVQFSLGWLCYMKWQACLQPCYYLSPDCFSEWVYYITSYCLCIRTTIFPHPCSYLFLSDFLFPANLRCMQCYLCVDFICISCTTGITSVVEYLALYLLVITVSSSVNYRCPLLFFFLLCCLSFSF